MSLLINPTHARGALARATREAYRLTNETTHGLK
jgi:hypothetical protein